MQAVLVNVMSLNDYSGKLAHEQVFLKQALAERGCI